MLSFCLFQAANFFWLILGIKKIFFRSIRLPSYEFTLVIKIFGAAINIDVESIRFLFLTICFPFSVIAA